MTYATPSAERGNPIAGVSNADLAGLVLRVSMGVLFLAHAGLKLFIFTPAENGGAKVGHWSGGMIPRRAA